MQIREHLRCMHVKFIPESITTLFSFTVKVFKNRLLLNLSKPKNIQKKCDKIFNYISFVLLWPRRTLIFVNLNIQYRFVISRFLRFKKRCFKIMFLIINNKVYLDYFQFLKKCLNIFKDKVCISLGNFFISILLFKLIKFFLVVDLKNLKRCNM